MQENNGFAMLHGVKMNIGNARLLIGQAGQFKVMGGEQGECPYRAGQMRRTGPRQRQAVEGAGAASDFINQYQAIRGGVVQDISRFAHLYHERRTAGRQIVGCADPGENPVDGTDDRVLGRDVTADMGQQHDQGSLAHEGGFTAEIGAGDHQHPPLLGF